MSDDQVRRERDLQKRLYDTLADARAAAQAVNEGSVTAKIDMRSFDNFVHDEMPSVIVWNERITEARNAHA